MERAVRLYLFLGLAACLGCSKSKDITPQEIPVRLFISSWEAAAAWTTTDSNGFRTFSFDRVMTELGDAAPDQTVVLVWAKDMPNYTHYGLSAPGTPLIMPFSGGNNRDLANQGFDPMVQTDLWDAAYRPGFIGIKYTTNAEDVVFSDVQPPSDIRFRYFVIPNAVLAQKGVSVEDVRKMSYRQLTGIMGVGE